MVKNGEDRTPQGTWYFAERYYQEISNLQQGSDSQQTHLHNVGQPLIGTIKINFDGSLKTESRKGVGVVARDASGMVLGFYQVVIDGVRDPETIETLAAIRAMEWGSSEFKWKEML